jgi:hypothetical protein
MNCLYCAFNSKEFNEISSCNSAKEIWEKLEATYEESSQIEEDSTEAFYLMSI